MVFLEALKCAQCGEQCDPAWNDEDFYEALACMECDTLICGNCTQKKLSCPQHPYQMVVSKNLSKICFFASYAPEDELRLIDLQIAGNDKCSACNCYKPTLMRHGIQQVVCKKCNPNWSHWWDASPASTLEILFCKIISELNERAMPKTRTHRNRVDGMLPVKIVVHCKACKEALRACNIIMFDGEPHCHECADRLRDQFPVSRRCDCLRLLIDLIQCIPENQLHLLTYSKWLKAVGCEQHRDIFYELNAVSAHGRKTGKLYSFFKKEEIARTLNIIETNKDPKPLITVNSAAEIDIQPSTSTLSNLGPSIPDQLEDIDSNPNISETSSIPKPTITDKTTAIANDRKQSTSTLSNLDPSIPDKLLPDRITCSCGREDELSNMFDCLTCSTYGMCGLCLGKKHWGHEMKESKKSVAFCLINSQSEATRQKLREMVEQAKGLSKEGEKSFEKLCHVLGVVFKDAMLSEDFHRIQSLLTKANTSELEKFFKSAMNSTTKLYKYIDAFCDDLLEAVDEEKQNTSVSVKEPSSTSRE